MKQPLPSGNEMRRNPATGQWVIYALSRRKRPRENLRAGMKQENLPAYDENCPFCPGNEHKLTEIIMERKAPGLHWQTRSVANRYPALTPVGIQYRIKERNQVSMAGYGHHEVIIESPVHNRQIPVMSRQEVDMIIESYCQRYISLMKIDKNMAAVIFRNSGARSGASLLHPHSQIITTGIAPEHIRAREYRAESYFDDWGTCLYCDILQQESAEKNRIIQENRSFLSFVPYAAEQPFEVWIMPKAHKADFGNISGDEIPDLSSILHELLINLFERLENPDYNYMIHSCVKYRSEEPHLHWFLQVKPRITTRAGFEMGSGMSVNTSLPEEDAAFLRWGE